MKFKFNYRKIGSVLASAAMLGSTMGIAAAASYPGAFTGGGADGVALVTGTDAQDSDFVAATDISNNLADAISSPSSGGEVTVSGETYPLFSSSSPLFINASINSVRDTLTKTQLPTVLKDNTFEGVVSSDLTQNIKMGADPRTIFSQQPSGDDDPQVGISLASSCSSGSCKYLYNATIDFDQTVDFTNGSSTGEQLTLFGQEFTVASSTTSTKLVLLKSSKTIDLSVGGNNPNPSQVVTIDGEDYTVELTAATDTSATIKVTGSDGKSDSKEVSEDASKKIQDLEVAINTADESTATNTLTAEVIVGASKVVFQDGTSVKVGTDEDLVEGTNVEFGGANNDQTINLTKITVQVVADSSDEDAITPGKSFLDPVFESFRVDFAGLNIGDDDSSRETISVKNSGGHKMTVQFTTHENHDIGAFTFAYNKSDAHGGGDTRFTTAVANANLFDKGMDLADDKDSRIVVHEMGNVNKSEFVVLGNEDDGGMFQITGITNSTSGYSDDEVSFKNLFSGETVTFAATSEGVTTATLLGRSYTVNYYGASSLAEEARYVRINHPDSSGNDMVLWPTIQTNKGAKVMFYEPVLINASDPFATGNTAGGANSTLNGSNILIPDGDGYTSIAIGGSLGHDPTKVGVGNLSIGGSGLINLTATETSNSATASVGRLTINFTNGNFTNSGEKYNGNITGGLAVYIVDDTDNANVQRPAIVVFEEKDDASVYEAMIVELDAGYDGDSAGIGVAEVTRTWGADGDQTGGFNNEIQLESDSDLYKEMDFWGSIITLDKSDSDQTTASISYPDDQVFAQIYVSASSASVTTGDGGAVTVVVVKDSESSKMNGKDLIVVGGSCVNTVAADLLGASGKLCGADFTDTTGVGAGEYLIETFSRSGGKVATLVAGFHAADTTAAATSLVTNKPDIGVGTKYTGSTADGSFGKSTA